MSNKVNWLTAELEAWQREGLIDSAQAERIRARYPRDGRGSRSVALVGFAVLGALLVGGGIILLLAHNWSDLGRGARTAVALAPLVASQLLALWGLVRGHDGAGWREALGVFWSLSIGAAIAMVSQIYHLSGSYDAFMVTWLLLGAPVIYLLRSSLSAVLYVAGVLAWSCGHACELPRVLWYWPFTAVVVPLLLRSSREGTFTSGLALLRWALTGSIVAGAGISLAHGLPGLWIVIYAALLSVLYLVDALLLGEAPSLWHRPMRVIGGAGCVVLALMLTYEWPWKSIGWDFLHRDLPAWQQMMDAAAALGLMGAAVAVVVARRELLRGPGLFPAIFPLVAMAGFAVTSHLHRPGLALLLCNVFVFAFGLTLLTSGVRRAALGRVNAGMLLLATVIALRFFDSDLSLVARGLVFVVLGAVFLIVNVVLSRRFRRSP